MTPTRPAPFYYDESGEFAKMFDELKARETLESSQSNEFNHNLAEEGSVLLPQNQECKEQPYDIVSNNAPQFSGTAQSSASGGINQVEIYYQINENASGPNYFIREDGKTYDTMTFAPKAEDSQLPLDEMTQSMEVSRENFADNVLANARGNAGAEGHETQYPPIDNTPTVASSPQIQHNFQQEYVAAAGKGQAENVYGALSSETVLPNTSPASYRQASFHAQQPPVQQKAEQDRAFMCESVDGKAVHDGYDSDIPAKSASTTDLVDEEGVNTVPPASSSIAPLQHAKASLNVQRDVQVDCSESNTPTDAALDRAIIEDMESQERPEGIAPVAANASNVPVVFRQNASTSKPIPGYDTVEDYLFQPGVGLIYLKTGERIANFTVCFSALIRRMKANSEYVEFYEVQAENRSGHRISFPISSKDMAKLAEKARGTDGRFHLFYDNRNAEMRFKTFVSLIVEHVTGNLPIRYEFDFLGWGVDSLGHRFYCSHTLPECVYSGTTHRYVPLVPEKDRPLVLMAWFDFLSVGYDLAAILPLWLYNSFFGFALNLLREAGFHGHTILMIRGKSGSLKSAVAEAMAMADARGGISFESTLAAMEEHLLELRDNVVNLDDINDPTDKEKTRNFEHLLRVLSNDIPKHKYDVVARKPRPLNYRVGCTITVEQQLSQSTSSRLRYVTLDVDRTSFNGDKLRPYQDDMKRAKANDGFTCLEAAYGLVIIWLEENYDSLVEELKHLNIMVDPRLREPRFISNYQDFMAITYLADRFLQDCIKHGYLLPEVLQCFRNYNVANMMTNILLANQAETVQTEGWKLALNEIMLGMADGSMPIAESAAHFEKGTGHFFGFRAPKGKLALMAEKVLRFCIDRVRARTNGNRSLTAKEIEDEFDKASIIGQDEPEGETTHHRRRQRFTVNKSNKRLWWTWNAPVASAIWEAMSQYGDGVAP